jgi:hypothetical protein
VFAAEVGSEVVVGSAAATRPEYRGPATRFGDWKHGSRVGKYSARVMNKYLEAYEAAVRSVACKAEQTMPTSVH